MLFSDMTFIGIDPTAGERPFEYAAIDHELSLLAVGQGSMDDVLAFTAGQSHAFVSVCSPRRPNCGLMARADVRAKLSPSPPPGRWTNFRVVEFILRRHNIRIPQTPNKESDCPNWMKMGFHLYRRLEDFGYRPYPGESENRQYMEVYPHACFSALLGILPFLKNTLEGRLQRQLVLYEQEIKVPDPMRVFEEFTRYRLMKGILPVEDLCTPGELDAIAAAYTAWMAATQPDCVMLLGESEEGQVVVPVPALNSQYHSG